jgi:polyprenyldihydroxybenzoate methyltransferase / 3-demethylubiquinol 3-O-methyltransferase
LKAKGNLTYKAELIQDHAKENPEKYDAIVASDVLEHVPDQELFLESCVKALKPGGSIFITTLNQTWTSWFFAIIWAEFILRLIPKHTHIWSQFISPENVSKILKKCGCDTLLVRGVEYQFYLFPGRFRYQSSQRIQYALHAVKAGGRLKKE